MTEGERLVLNEKLKASAAVMLNLGAALLTASAARMWLNGSLAPATVIWLIGSIGLFVAGLAVLEWLDSGTP